MTNLLYIAYALCITLGWVGPGPFAQIYLFNNWFVLHDPGGHIITHSGAKSSLMPDPS